MIEQQELKDKLEELDTALSDRANQLINTDPLAQRIVGQKQVYASLITENGEDPQP